MTDNALPAPVTQADEYALATVIELRQLNLQVAELVRLFTPPEPAVCNCGKTADDISLREPEQRKRSKP